MCSVQHCSITTRRDRYDSLATSVDFSSVVTFDESADVGAEPGASTAKTGNDQPMTTTGGRRNGVLGNYEVSQLNERLKQLIQAFVSFLNKVGPTKGS